MSKQAQKQLDTQGVRQSRQGEGPGPEWDGQPLPLAG